MVACTWPDIARELALVIYPDLEPGRVSGVFLQALAPETATDADAVLDALGVPRLAAVAPMRRGSGNANRWTSGSRTAKRMTRSFHRPATTRRWNDSPD